jgi:hypothetical protein
MTQPATPIAACMRGSRHFSCVFIHQRRVGPGAFAAEAAFLLPFLSAVGAVFFRFRGVEGAFVLVFFRMAITTD